MKNLIGIIIISIYIAIVLASSKLLNKFGEEASRKFVHIMLSNYAILAYLFFDSIVWASILPLAFVVINSLSYKFKLVKSIEREENDGFGTIYYALSLFIIAIFTYLVHMPIIGILGVLIMGYGDGFAAIIGTKIKSKKYKIGNAIKSVAGSLTMFFISLILSIILFKILGVNYLILKALGIAIISTILEAISIKGLDNITVPLAVTVLTFLAV